MNGDRPPDGATMVTGAERGWAWVDHLRAGGSTPWHDFEGTSDAPRAGARLLPGAIQLEVARRLNALGGRDDTAHRDLVEAVLTASAPGRGQPDLELVGIHDGSPFGPPPVDPADLPAEELVRMAVGVLADRALARPAPSAVEPRRLPVPWRRGLHLVGDPVLAEHSRDALRAAGRRPGLRSPVVVLHADDLPGMLADVWTWRVQHGVTPSWTWWLGHWAGRDELPPRVDLTAVAADWAARVGRDRVRLVVGTPPAALLGASPGPRPRPLSADAVELLTRVNGVLRVLVTPERHQRLLAQVLVPLLAEERGARPAVPPRRRAWVRGRAERLVEELSRAGYPVHGDLASLLPGNGEESDATTAAGVLDVALRALLRTRDQAPDQTRHEATGSAGAREVER
ncbi:MAG: hypothetical protein ABWX84_15325 [Nocardioides sp.]